MRGLVCDSQDEISGTLIGCPSPRALASLGCVIFQPSPRPRRRGPVAVEGPDYPSQNTEAITALTVFYEVKAADLARPAVSELRNRIADRLRLDPLHVATFQAGIIGQRRNANVLTFGLTTLLNISALIYAVIH